MASLRTLGVVFALGGVMVGAAMAAPLEIPKPRNGFHLWNLSGEGGSGVVVGIMPKEVDGKIALCGAFWPIDEKRASIASQNHEFHDGVIKIKGKVVPVRLDVFPFFETRSSAKTFRCAVSDQPWQGPYKGSEFKMSLRR